MDLVGGFVFRKVPDCYQRLRCSLGAYVLIKNFPCNVSKLAGIPCNRLIL